MIESTPPSTGECKKIVEYLQKEQPLLIQDARKQVEKPDPHFDYFAILYQLLDLFCQKRNITTGFIKGVHISRQAVEERFLFIGVILKLYSPGVFNSNVSYSIEDGLRQELWRVLECNKEWISQQVRPIVVRANNKRLEFSEQITEMEQYLKDNLKVKEVKEEEPVVLTMFQ